MLFLFKINCPKTGNIESTDRCVNCPKRDNDCMAARDKGAGMALFYAFAMFVIFSVMMIYVVFFHEINNFLWNVAGNKFWFGLLCFLIGAIGLKLYFRTNRRFIRWMFTSTEIEDN